MAGTKRGKSEGRSMVQWAWGGSLIQSMEKQDGTGLLGFAACQVGETSFAAQPRAIRLPCLSVPPRHPLAGAGASADACKRHSL